MCDQKASKRWGLAIKVRSWLRRPGTFRIASFVLNLFSLIVRIIDFFE